MAKLSVIVVIIVVIAIVIVIGIAIATVIGIVVVEIDIYVIEFGILFLIGVLHFWPTDIKLFQMRVFLRISNYVVDWSIIRYFEYL